MSQDPVISAEDTLRVSVLSEALPYIQRFAGRRVVVKYGGAAMVREDLREAVFRDLALLACVGDASNRVGLWTYGALWAMRQALRQDADSLGLRAGVGLVAGEPAAMHLVRRHITIRPSTGSDLE